MATGLRNTQRTKHVALIIGVAVHGVGDAVLLILALLWQSAGKRTAQIAPNFMKI